MIQFLLYGFCFILYLAIYIEQRRQLHKMFRGMGNLPIYPFIGSAPSMYRKDGRDFFHKLNHLFKKHGEKFYFIIENRLYVAFSGQEDIKVGITFLSKHLQIYIIIY